MKQPLPVPVRVAGVFEAETEELGRAPFVLLEDEAARRLPIQIGPCEAVAISIALESAPVERPLSHDLMNQVLSALGGKLQSVLVDDFSDRVFYAKLRIERGGEALEVDARPSDAIALALRAEAPIFVNDEVLSAGSISPDEPPEGTESAAPEEDE